MLELNAFLDIVDKRYISQYKNEEFDQIIRSTTKILNLAEIAHELVMDKSKYKMPKLRRII